MGVRPSNGNTVSAAQVINQQTEDGTNETKQKDKNDESSNVVDKIDDFGGEIVEQDTLLVTKLPNGKLSEWEARRYGSMAARLLRDVKIT